MKFKEARIGMRVSVCAAKYLQYLRRSYYLNKYCLNEDTRSEVSAYFPGSITAIDVNRKIVCVNNIKTHIGIWFDCDALIIDE